MLDSVLEDKDLPTQLEYTAVAFRVPDASVADFERFIPEGVIVIELSVLTGPARPRTRQYFLREIEIRDPLPYKRS